MNSVRALVWLGFAGIAFLSMAPARWIYRPALPEHADHALAYLLLGSALAWAYPSPGRRCLALAVLIASAALLEVGQLFLDSRYATMADFLASAAGAIAGVLVGSGLMRAIRGSTLGRGVSRGAAGSRPRCPGRAERQVSPRRSPARVRRPMPTSMSRSLSDDR
jgi:hypothetical protein